MTPGFGRYPREGKGYPLQYSGMENSMDYIVHGLTKSRTQLNNFHFTSLHSCLQVIRVLLSPVHLSHVNLILRPARELTV